jgi:hypothetical protein
LDRAVGYRHRWFKPDGRPSKNFEEALTSREPDRAREFRAAQNRGNLGIDRRGKCDDVYFFCAQRPLRDTVRLERRAYQS